jgi:ABC-type phosphate transport system permease subunit
MALPSSYREGAVALGATRWQAVRRVLLPAARSGIIQAATLSLGRAMGETMIVLMMTKNDPVGLWFGLPQVRSVTATIAMEVPYAVGDHRAALFGAGAVLLVLVLLVNSLARRLG